MLRLPFDKPCLMAKRLNHLLNSRISTPIHELQQKTPEDGILQGFRTKYTKIQGLP
jgi:hypothetical protein